METNNQTHAAAEGLNLSDPRHQLIYALRLRLQALRAAEANSVAESTSQEQQENISLEAGTAGSQPFTAGTQPGCSRDEAGTQSGYPGRPAGTDNPSSEAPARHATASEPTKPKRKITESPLTELSPETQAEILRLLQTLSLDAATLEITATPPYGMGIATSRSSLHRFLQAHTRVETIKRREQEAAETAKLIAEAKSAGDLSHTATHVIALRLLETAVAENSNPAHLLTLSKAIDRLRAVEHAERRLQLAEQKAASAHRSAGKSPAQNISQ